MVGWVLERRYLRIGSSSEHRHDRDPGLREAMLLGLRPLREPQVGAGWRRHLPVPPAQGPPRRRDRARPVVHPGPRRHRVRERAGRGLAAAQPARRRQPARPGARRRGRLPLGPHAGERPRQGRGQGSGAVRASQDDRPGQGPARRGARPTEAASPQGHPRPAHGWGVRRSGGRRGAHDLPDPAPGPLRRGHGGAGHGRRRRGDRPAGQHRVRRRAAGRGRVPGGLTDPRVGALPTRTPRPPILNPWQEDGSGVALSLEDHMLPPPPVSGPITISWSEIDSFRQCPFKWRLGYAERWVEPETSPALTKGLLWHKVLEIHYNILANGGTLGECIERIQAYLNYDESGWAELVAWMYNGYIQYWQEEDRRLDFIQAETKLDLPLIPGLVNIKCRLDLLCRDWDGMLWMWDHKSCRNLPNKKETDLDDQFALCQW